MVSKEKRDRIMKKALSVAKFRSPDSRIKSDVNGSYTGVPINEKEKPVQDADDL